MNENDIAWSNFFERYGEMFSSCEDGCIKIKSYFLDWQDGILPPLCEDE